MIIILILAGIVAGGLILASMSKGEITAGSSGGGGAGGNKKWSGYPGSGSKTGGAVGGSVKYYAGLTYKTEMGSKDRFFRSMANLVKGYDWDKFLPMAMAGLETKFAMSCYFNNLFNITTQSTDPEQFFMHKTIPDLKFKIYIGYAESVKHFWDLLQFPRYSEALKNRNNPEQAIIELIKGGYAGHDPLTGKPVTPERYLSTLRFIQTYYATHFG